MTQPSCAGLHAWDAASGEHILSTVGLTSETVASCGPFILRQVADLLFCAGPLILFGLLFLMAGLPCLA